MKNYTFNVMVIVDGYPEIHTEDINENNANELCENLKRLFPNFEYYVECVEYKEKIQRHYNENAIDGWEDLYPLNE